MSGYLFSGFADEAGVSVERQMDVLEKNGIFMIEMRGVDKGHVIDKSGDELKALKEKLDKKGFTVSAIGSPVGKSPIGEDFAVAKGTFMKAVNAAKALGVKYIRGFSFYTPEGEDPMAYADEAIRRLKELVKIAEGNGVIYALENESGIFTDLPSRCLYAVEALGSDSFKMAFDPGNFVMNNAKPYPDAYRLLKDHIAYFHVKDATLEPRRFVPSGEGETEMGPLLAEAYKDGFRGVLSLEPHLKYLDQLNDAQRFTTAVNALKKTLNGHMQAGLPLLDLAEFKGCGQE